MKIKTASIVIGVAFLAVGLLGYTSNPIVGADNALFHTDSLHNMVHIISGLLFLVIGLAAPGSASIFLKVFGIVYFLLGVVGLITFGSDGMGALLGFLHVNGPDNFLHIGLGLIIFLAGTMGARVQTVS